MIKITNKEAALLNLLSEKPKHAYEIEQDIKERDMRYWTEISMSSVYKLLNKLEAQELLRSSVKLSKKNAAQKIYALTTKGRKAFRDKLHLLLSTWEATKYPLDIGLASLWMLGPEEVIGLLTQYGGQLDKMLACYTEELEKYLKEHQCPPGNVHLATRRLFMLAGEKKWLQAFIKELQSGKEVGYSARRMNDSIIITNASTHNLKKFHLEIPKNKLVVFTGVSGSGKSSLVFDTMYTEAQRQLIETFSSFARRCLPKLSRPPVDAIATFPPRSSSTRNAWARTCAARSGTATEVGTYLRLLFSRCGDRSIGRRPSCSASTIREGMCPDCQGHGQEDLDGRRSPDPLGQDDLREGAVDHPDYRVGGWNWRRSWPWTCSPVDTPLRDFSERDKERFLYAEAIPVEKRHGAGIYTKNFEGVARKLERLHLSKPAERAEQAPALRLRKVFRATRVPRLRRQPASARWRAACASRQEHRRTVANGTERPRRLPGNGGGRDRRAARGEDAGRSSRT